MSTRLRTFPVLAALASLILVGLPAPSSHAASRGSALARLETKVAKALRHNGSKHFGYAINDSAYGAFGLKSSDLFAPASNEKLFTTITLLQEVGASFHYDTVVRATAPVVNHVVDGDLVVYGSGDPTLTRSNLIDIAKRLHQRGLRRVTGNLIIDDSRYSHKTVVAGWKASFVPGESGTMDAFSVDHNEWRGGHAFEQNPSHANGKLLRRDLRHAHVKIGTRVFVRRSPQTAASLLTHRSPTLGAIVDATLTDSINFDAEMMLREAGAQRYGHGSPKTGIAAERAVAAQLGLSLGVVHDGSGLSYANREKPVTFMNWLLRLRSLPIFPTVYYALPLSCSTGTLKYRFCGHTVSHQVRAKTGTLTKVSTLSGYVTTQSGHVITFSFLAGRVKSFSALYAAINRAMVVLRNQG